MLFGVRLLVVGAPLEKGRVILCVLRLERQILIAEDLSLRLKAQRLFLPVQGLSVKLLDLVKIVI